MHPDMLQAASELLAKVYLRSKSKKEESGPRSHSQSSRAISPHAAAKHLMKLETDELPTNEVSVTSIRVKESRVAPLPQQE